VESVAGFAVELAAEREKEQLLAVEQRLQRKRELLGNRHQRRSRRRRPCWSGIDEVVDVKEAGACLNYFGAFSAASTHTLSLVSRPSYKKPRQTGEKSLIEQVLRRACGERKM
jgi:hypothetical protein